MTRGLQTFVSDVRRETGTDGQEPVGLYYDNKTYMVAARFSTGDPYICYYNHFLSAQQWSSFYKVGTNPLNHDAHSTPVLMRDSTGYFHVFFGAHNSSIYHSKSTNVDDITAWTEKGAIGDAFATHPYPILASNGDIYLFYRGGTSGNEREVEYIKSTDDGENWGAAVTVIQFDANHATYFDCLYEGDRVHICITYNDDVRNYNVYYVYFQISDGHLYSADGTDLGTQLTEAEANTSCKVFDSGTDRVGYIHNALVVSATEKYVLFLHCDTSVWTFKCSKWNGTAWSTPVDITTTDDVSNEIVGIATSSNTIEAYLLGSGSSGFGGDLEKWVTSDGGATWVKDKTILIATDSGQVLARPHIIQNYNWKAKVSWTQWINNWTTNLKGYVWGERDYNIEGSLFTTIKNAVRHSFKGNPNFEVTRSELSFGDRDATTGWYAKNYTESTIEMVIIQKESQQLALQLGYWVSLDALGFTITPVETCDLITDNFDRTWEIKAVKPIMVGNVVYCFICDLKELPLNA